MDNKNDWKRVARPGAPSRPGKYGNERQENRDGNKGSRGQYSKNYNATGNRGYNADNYGNRMEDNHYYGDRGEDSGYIDLGSAVDSIPGKRKRKRIAKEAPELIPESKPYKKIDVQKKVVKKSPPQPKPPTERKKKLEAPIYPDIVFDKPIRLNRYIANTGLCSRREADTHIKAGLIKVNGELINEVGVKIDPAAEVRFKDEILTHQRKIYLLLNKPKGFVTSLDEPEGKKLVVDLVRGACKERIYPVGRLDKMTTGVLLFTNDGDLSLKLTHPSNRMRKVYQASIDKPLAEEDLEKLAAGVELEDGSMAFDSITYADTETKTLIGVEIHSGKNRIVRRMFEAVGYKVLKLDRVYFAGLTRKGLKRGKWRFLSPEEVAFLKMMPTCGHEEQSISIEN